MFTRLGQLSVRHHRLVLGLSVAFLLLAGVLGVGVFGRLHSGGFDDPRAESTQVDKVLDRRFHSGTPNLILLVDAGDAAVAPTGAGSTRVDDPAVTSAADALLAKVRRDPDVSEALSYWSLGRVAPLRSSDGNSAMVVARIGGNEDTVAQATERLTGRDTLGRHGPITVSAGGQGPVFQSVSTTIKGDLSRAESVAVPITLILLVLVFGGLVAAGLPLLVGMVSVLGTFFTLWVVSQVTDLSIFSINLVTAMGLGLAIDYSLFIVSRFREELHKHPKEWWGPADRRAVDAAIVRTVETAGRTVAVSALTVGVSLSALLVFPLYFLRSFAWAGIGVTLVAAGASVLTLPALLVVLGRRVDALRLFHRNRPPVEVGEGFWHRVAVGVMKRPVVVSVSVVLFLLLLGAPFLVGRVRHPGPAGPPEHRRGPAHDRPTDHRVRVRRGRRLSRPGPLRRRFPHVDRRRPQRCRGRCLRGAGVRAVGGQSSGRADRPVHRRSAGHRAGRHAVRLPGRGRCPTERRARPRAHLGQG